MKIAGNKKKSKNLDTVESSTLEEKKNNNFSSKFLNKKSGITMVALVVTIVVLLILASISIQGITRTGIFRAAEDTKLEHKRASIATTLQTKLKINQTEQIRGTDEEIVKATYEDVKNDLEEIKKAGGKDIEVSEVTSEEKDGKTEWFFEVKVDGDVYKVGLDGSDYLGKEDELAPLIEIKKATATTNAITATVTTRRNEGGKIEYYIKEKGSQKFDLAGTTDQNTFKYTKLKQETTYVIEAVAINTNGKKKVSKEYEIKTSLVPKIDSNEIKFASVPNEWTNKSVEVTATLTVDGQNFTLTTSKNSTSGWIASNRQIFTENGTMYAALTDGNNYGIAASHEVTNIDTTKPIVKSLSVTTNTIKITATDEASGIYSYAISESETMPKTFTKLDNSTQVFNTVVENLKQSTKYYVWVKDVAGNISEVASTKTGTVPKLTDANTTITKSPNDWTKQEVIATASTTEKNYTLQTKKDNGEWQTTNTQKFTENGTIYARLWDGTNAGEEIYKPITNIDKTAPTATNIEIKNVTPAGYDVYVYGVKDNGSGVNRVQFPTWTEAKGQDDIQPNWQTGASSKGTKQADGTTWVYHVNITDHKTEAGEYNTHIYAYDNLENVKCIGTKKITVPMVKITYNENYVKDGTTNKQTVEKIYNTELGTLRTPTRTGYTFAGWFTEATGGTQISSTTKTPVTDTTYYAHWNANPLNFANQTISKTFSTSEQKADITGASNGTGNYTYTEKTEKNSAQKDTNYISINGTTITIAANTPADTYTYVIVATDNNSKVTKEATYTIKIERAKTANAGASDKTYNGTNQTGVTGTNVTWTGTTSAIDAGTYTATATPDGNHAWSDGTTNAKAITWKINPKSVAVTWGTTTTFTYNGNAQAPTAAATSGVANETINVTRTTGTNAGSYTSTASISSVTGGRARKENYTLTGNTKAFTINKANATMTDPTLATGLVYNTKAQNLIAKAGNGAGGTIKYGLGANNTTAPTSWNTSVTGTDAGTYYVWSKVDADGNHNNVGAKYIGTVTIEKATVTIPTSPVKQYTYNGKAQAHGYTLPTGTAIENNGTTANATDAGTYNIVLKLTSESNYQWSDKTTTNKTINWKINPKSVTVTWGATSFTYNGQAQAPTASATSGVTGETINVTRTTGTNAGTYTSTASISSVSGGRANKANYTLSGNTKAFTINPSSTAIKVYYPTSATAVSLKTVYRNKCSSSSTVLSTTNTGTSNNVLASTYNGLYGSFGGYATAVNTTTRATTAIAGIATRAETTYYVVTTGSNTSSITATFNYYNGSAWTSTTKAGTRTNNYAYYCTSTTAAKTATAYSHGSIAAPSTSAGPYSTAYVGWSTGSKSMSTTSVTTANTTYYAVYRSNVTVKVVTGTAAANVTSKTIYRNAMKDGTVLSESNTGTSNLTTISGAYNYAGLATSSGTGTITAITTCAASTTNTFYTVGITKSNATITVTYKYQNGSNDTTATGTKTTTTKYYINSANQVSSTTTVSSPSFTMPKPTRTGYEMDGWNTSSTATTATYTAGQKVSIGNSTTLYAIWYQCAAKINTTYYRTVQKAIDSVATSTSTSTTVTVLKNVTENITILENKIIALNLNEKTIKGDVSNKGTLNIYGGTVDGKSAKKSNCIANIGTLTVTNGTYSGKDQGIYNYSGTTTVKGGTISGGNWGIYGDGMIIVSGGNSTGSSYAGIGTCQGTLKITGGSFTGGYNGIRVWDNNANATIEITNGTFTGKTDSGLLVKKTKATISGGTYDGKDGTDGGYFEQCNAEIKGGTFTGKNYGLKNINGTFTITGGKFRGNTEDGFFNEKGTSYINGGYFTGYKWGINSPSGKIWYHRTDAQYSDNKYVSSQGWSAVTASDLSFY